MDCNKRSALHHAVDASSYSWRAFDAAVSLVEVTAVDVINTHTTGSQPRGYTCLHFACDGSDKTFGRANLASALIAKKADMEATDAKGNTPLLLATGAGLVDVVKVLIGAGADVTVQNNNGTGVWQKASRSSSSLKKALSQEPKVPKTMSGASGKTRTSTSDSRQARHSMNDQWRGSPSPSPSWSKKGGGSISK